MADRRPISRFPVPELASLPDDIRQRIEAVQQRSRFIPNDEDAWDIAAIAAFFALSNRMANFTDMRPNDEFYSLGRVTDP